LIFHLENIKNRAFQEFAQIKVTGELNDETKKKMAEPRCGVVDIRAMGSTRGKIFKTPIVSFYRGHGPPKIREINQFNK
jgi:hypothetical protein